MGRVDVLRPHMEKVVKAYLGDPAEVVMLDNGEIPIIRGSVRYYVRMVDVDPVLVQVYCPILEGVTKTPELLEALNELNIEWFAARVFWVADKVIIATELVAETLDQQEMTVACNNVSAIADQVDEDLQKRFGGSIFQPEAGAPENPVEV